MVARCRSEASYDSACHGRAARGAPVAQADPEFRVHRPRSAAEAVAMKTAAGPGSVYMAGGIDVVNRMKSGLSVTDAIHLGAVAGLDTIEEAEDGLRLGALVTHDRMATSPLVQTRLPALAQTWPDVANIRIRCKGTIGGNIMGGDPAYDFSLAALAANARLHFLTVDGSTRAVSVAEPGEAMPNGLLTAVSMPSGTALRLVFDRSLRPIVTVALGFDVVEGRINGGRVAIGCAHATPLTVNLPLDGPLLPGELAHRAERLAQEVAIGLPALLTDHHATSRYRRRMIEVLMRRNLSTAA
jgi:carbon-monoxide dehydrogenase medium subunit